ncbi:A/G-specific adenine glycosylase [Thermosynechococcus sp.]|uniref:A/G-specific adenine glycosylase n=1 Tax=Thermosynechococcus sp. TaxID=2814275 RepID=UPI00391974CE
MPTVPERGEALPALRFALLEWYQQQGRDLPWRHTRDPYAIWVSEIMLQQTQVGTVIPYYRRWLAAFPTIADLAATDLEAVLKLWQGLGYYARARHLHRAAQQIMANHGGQFPRTYEAVVALPGIGRSTAGAILSAAFNQPRPILDGNVKRVLARLYGLPIPPQQAEAQLWQWSAQLLCPQSPRDFNQALMDLGATLCTPRQPLCHACPWQSHCIAHHHRLTHEIPRRMSRSPLPHKEIGVGVIWNAAGQILIDRRPPRGLLGGLWEFPGGKIEPNETVQECIRREIREELGIEIAVGEHLIDIDHAYTHFRVTLHVYYCRHVSGTPQPLACEAIRWVTPEELAQFPFPKANTAIIEAIRTRGRPTP